MNGADAFAHAPSRRECSGPGILSPRERRLAQDSPSLNLQVQGLQDRSPARHFALEKRIEFRWTHQ